MNIDKFWEVFDEPFGVMKYSFGSVSDILKYTIHNNNKRFDIGDFPNNISKVIWWDANDCGDYWCVVGELITPDNKLLHFHYNAWCGFSGFTCNCGMELYVTDEGYDHLLDYFVDDYTRVQITSSNTVKLANESKNERITTNPIKHMVEKHPDEIQRFMN